MKTKQAPGKQRPGNVGGVDRKLESLRGLSPTQFKIWAVNALGSTMAKPGAGAYGLAGRIYVRGGQPAALDRWYPVQARRKDKVARLDIGQFEAAMMREARTVGFFVAFDYTAAALQEIRTFFTRTGRMIRALTVADLLDEAQLGAKLA